MSDDVQAAATELGQELGIAVEQGDDLVTVECVTLDVVLAALAQAQQEIDDCRQILAADMTAPGNEQLPDPTRAFQPGTLAFCVFGAIQELRLRREQWEQAEQENARLRDCPECMPDACSCERTPAGTARAQREQAAQALIDLAVAAESDGDNASLLGGYRAMRLHQAVAFRVGAAAIRAQGQD